jgi:uncharacterized membrane protein
MAGPKVTPKSIVQIPTPKMVAEYEAVSPERCDQMLRMVQRELDRNNRYAFMGMSLAFTAFLILIGSAAWMAYDRNYQAMWAFTSATMVGLVSAFLGARR